MRKQPPNVHPGKVLLEEFLRPRNLSQNRLARSLDVPPRRVNEIVLGKRRITADTALRLAEYFENSPDYWLGLQDRFDLEQARHRSDGLREREGVPARAAGARGTSLVHRLQKHRSELLAIAERYGARDVRIFGSVARGEDTAESDVDLLVRFEKAATLLDQGRLIAELERLLGREVDVVSESGLKPRIRERVLAEARPL